MKNALSYLIMDTRRSFLTNSALLATAASAGRVLGANDRIRIGVVGAGGRGKYLMRSLVNMKANVEFAAVCDVWDVRRNEGEKAAGAPVQKYGDHRQVTDRKDIDAVIVATPDHWHAAVAVDALNAGKDVWVEKPMVHKPADGQRIVKAVRANRRVLQAGTQGRALPHFVEAKAKYVDSGILGKVGLVRTYYLSNRGYIQKAPPGMERKPEGLDWDRWCGPGPKVAWNPDIYFSPYKWLHYCGGMIMGIGIHVLDSAHHYLNLTKPVAVACFGGNYHYDDRDTPDAVSLIAEYPQATVTFSAECLTCPGVKTQAGIELRGAGGKLVVERYLPEAGYEYTPNDRFSKEPAARVAGPDARADDLLKDWLDAMRTRRKPVANEEAAYYSTVVCAMAVMAYETRSRVAWDRAWDLPA